MRCALACVAVLVVLTGCGGAPKDAARPDLQRVLDSLVTGPFRAAPGATAYVSGPRGTWQGAAGWANVTKQIRMTPDTRGRLGSVSKLWTATAVLKLADEGKLNLDDTVEHWLPHLFPYGERITVRELLNHTSGMIDDNDLQARPRYWLPKIHDPQLRAELAKVSAEAQRNPRVSIPAMLEMRTAAALPLLFAPGTGFHYSNIGYKTAAAIAEKAGGATLSQLYDRIIVKPLGLTSAGYDPYAAIAGPHAVGYIVERGGKATPATGFASGNLAASGGVVADAQDEARFLVALVEGKILSKRDLAQLESPSGEGGYGLGTGVETPCGGVMAITHGGATHSFMAEAGVSTDGKRVAVLLINGRTWNSWGDDKPVEAFRKLFCAA